jgi:hypothetical protein
MTRPPAAGAAGLIARPEPPMLAAMWRQRNRKGLRMTEEWEYQLRIEMPDEVAETTRRDPGKPVLRPLAEILKRHEARLKSQYDAFAEYVAQAEREGIEKYPLYQWTKDTIEEPAKRRKYQKSFTLYVGGAEVYARERAEALEAELRPLVGGPLITRLAKHDTDPARNPQMPARYRK